MLEQVGNALTFYSYFVASKLGKTGLTVTVDVYRNGVSVVTAGAATEVGGGGYRYTLAAGTVNAEGEYFAVFKTADTSVDQQHVPSLWVVGKAGVEHLDASISSRSTLTAAQVWDALTSGLATAGSIGKRIVDYLTGDAFARLGAPAGASVSADLAAVQADTNDLQARLPAALVGGRMDASVGAMSANVLTASALGADAAAEIAAAVETAILNEGDLSAVLEAIRLKIEESDDDLTTSLIRDAILDRVLAGNHDAAGTVGQFLQKLDALVSSRMAAAAYTAPDNAAVALIKAKTDNLPADPASNTQVSTRAAAADWTAARALKIDNLDQAVSSRSTLTAAEVWGTPARTLTGFGTLIADVAAAVWGRATSALTADGSVGKHLLDQLAAIRAKAELLGGARVTVTSPLAPDGRSLELVAGDDYHAGHNRALEWQDNASQWPDLSGAEVTLEVQTSYLTLEVAGVVVTPTGSGKKVRFEPEAAETVKLRPSPSPYRFFVRAKLADEDVVTLAAGRVTVR